MVYNRIGFGTDFVLKNGNIGIATTTPREKLEVAGTIIGDFQVTETTTFQSSYSGFTPQKQNIVVEDSVGIATVDVGTFVQPYETETGNVNLDGNFTTVSEDIIVEEGKIFEVTEDVVIGITTLGTQDVYVPNDSEVSVGILESVSIQNHFSVPDGGITERQQNPIEGSVRFNDDLNTLEFYNGIEWRQFTVTGASGRGVFGGGVYGGGYISTSSIEFININSLGNSTNFGVLTASRAELSSCSNSTRGLFGGGRQPAGNSPHTDIIEYTTIASEGNSIDFGNLSVARYGMGGCSSSTRGLFGGGYILSGGNQNIIDYVEIETLGNALDFGDLTISRRYAVSFSSSTRGFWGHGITPASPFNRTTIIDYVTMSSKGDAVDFGNLSYAANGSAGLSNSVRGVFAGGGYISYSKIIEYITLSSTGNSITFGDLSQTKAGIQGTSTQVRGVFAGGSGDSPYPLLNNIEYITIATTGNSQDFGDLSITRTSFAGFSDSHGGLGGF